MKKIFIVIILTASRLFAGPYPPAAGSSGSDAMSKDDSRFVAWANGYLSPTYGSDVDAVWKTPAKALGKALGDSYDIVCLGNGGAITLYFPNPIRDGQGPDFAVFENSISNTFLELGFVEVSSDGTNFFRFPNRSLTPGAVGAFGSIDPSNLSGLAGKYRQGFGTPFDLADLGVSASLDKQHVRFVRVVDIIGNGATKDSQENPIYDPTPTVGSGGFDLEAIGVMYHNDGEFQIRSSNVAGNEFQMTWESNPGSVYRIETSTGLLDWSSVQTVSGNPISGISAAILPTHGDSRRFWRVVRLP